MSAHSLLLTVTDNALANLGQEDFLWRPRGEESSMATTLGSQLEGLGAVPDLNIDLVRLAALVFFCDRTVERPRSFRREYELTVPVSAPAAWSAHSDRLGALLSLLTGDTWQLTFQPAPSIPLGDRAEPPPGDVTILFSGGADSAAGTIVGLDAGHQPILASHHDWRNVRGQQKTALSAIESTLGVTLANASWRLARQSLQVGSRVEFANEPSRRSRSMVFVALGLAVAAVADSELWVAENGFTSLNPPLSGERRGANSTRTTHPAFLRGLKEVLTDVGLAVRLRNPFEELTKGEAFALARDAVGAAQAGAILSATNSCAKPQRLQGFAPDAHCGVCMGCLVRRGAFIAAGIPDTTVYIEQTLNAPTRAGWLSPTRRATYDALHYRVAIGFDETDILDLGLPDDTDLDAALALASKGLAEAAQVTIP